MSRWIIARLLHTVVKLDQSPILLGVRQIAGIYPRCGLPSCQVSVILTCGVSSKPQWTQDSQYNSPNIFVWTSEISKPGAPYGSLKFSRLPKDGYLLSFLILNIIRGTIFHNVLVAFTGITATVLLSSSALLARSTTKKVSMFAGYSPELIWLKTTSGQYLCGSTWHVCKRFCFWGLFPIWTVCCASDGLQKGLRRQSLICSVPEIAAVRIIGEWGIDVAG